MIFLRIISFTVEYMPESRKCGSGQSWNFLLILAASRTRVWTKREEVKNRSACSGSSRTGSRYDI